MPDPVQFPQTQQAPEMDTQAQASTALSGDALETYLMQMSNANQAAGQGVQVTDEPQAAPQQPQQYYNPTTQGGGDGGMVETRGAAPAGQAPTGAPPSSPEQPAVNPQQPQDGADEQVTVSREQLAALLDMLNGQAQTSMAEQGFVQPEQPEPQAPQPGQQQAAPPQAQAAPQQQQGYEGMVADVPEFDLSDDQYRDMFLDKSKFVEVQRAREQALMASLVGAFQQALPQVAFAEAMKAVGAVTVSQKFFADNPGLEQYPNLVNDTLAKVRAQNPTASPDEVLEMTKQAIAPALALVDKVKANRAAQTVDVRPQRGQFAQAGRRAAQARQGAPQHPGQQQAGPPTTEQMLAQIVAMTKQNPNALTGRW